MIASSVFQDVLKYIESSNLNFVIQRTPFSANISIKSSFIKKYSENQKVDTVPVVKSITKFILKDERSDLNEVLKVTKDLEIAKAKIATLEDSLEKEREMAKSFQGELSNQREEALKLNVRKRK